MRKAVVPFRSDEKFNNRPMVQVGAQGGWNNLLSCSGKLTKEDIETLVRVYEEFRPDTWKDKSECMVLAVQSVGFEVED